MSFEFNFYSTYFVSVTTLISILIFYFEIILCIFDSYYICHRHDHYHFNCPMKIESPHSSVKSYLFIFFFFEKLTIWIPNDVIIRRCFRNRWRHFVPNNRDIRRKHLHTLFPYIFVIYISHWSEFYCVFWNRMLLWFYKIQNLCIF